MEGSGEDNRMAKIRTVDGGQLDVPIAVLKVSGYFSDFLEGSESVNEELDISPFQLVTKEMMEYVVEFSKLAILYKSPNISRPIFHQSIYEVTWPVYAEFADKFDDEKLSHLILVADRLNNQPLLELLSAQLAIKIQKLEGKLEGTEKEKKDQTTQKIREYFQITDPFDSPESEKRIKAENEEAFEMFDLNDDDD
ncbi:UNKNOWN [Stylonychia lemnae]|uniref:Uncharacterized protein n=1 Tax=Stylonychia lemnae TaxID=5949 RepID=A0A078A3P6_STYLE|nr:UNKNOWN [Stylonychia lemnae]|eukprot:CDW76873.1 UNKNOWN [Stylonychia lemnae]